MTAPTSPDVRRRRWPVVLALVLGLLGSLVLGVTSASVEGSLGPHEARYSVTTDSTVTIDLGPLGTLQIDSPLPLTLGLHATVQEIPEGLTEVTPATTLSALSGDLQSYLQLFSAPKATIEQVSRDLVANALVRSLGYFALFLGGWAALYLLLGPARRSELAVRLAPYAGRLAAGVVIVLAGATVLTASSPGGDHGAVAQAAPSAVFAGTPLAGARVTGRLGGVIDTYGIQVVDAYKQNQAYYARADRNLAKAWDQTARTTAAQEAARAAASAAETEAPAGTPSPSGSPSPTSTVVPATGDKLVTVLLVSDLHCNVGMAPLIHTLAERSHAKVVLDGGDTTLDGTSVEGYCDTTFADAVPKGVALVTSPGNHDSSVTSARYAKAGATVLDGKPVTVDGIRILGDHDPNETRVGQGTSQIGQETAADEGRRLAEVACTDKTGVDLLLIHTPWVGDPVMATGCVPAQLSGHLHVRYGPEQKGEGVRYISASTAGAVQGKPTIGPLQGTAEMTVLRWDTRTHRFVDYQLVQVTPDTRVTVGTRQPWPVPRSLQELRPPQPGPTPV